MSVPDRIPSQFPSLEIMTDGGLKALQTPVAWCKTMFLSRWYTVRSPVLLTRFSLWSHPFLCLDVPYSTKFLWTKYHGSILGFGQGRTSTTLEDIYFQVSIKLQRQYYKKFNSVLEILTDINQSENHWEFSVSWKSLVSRSDNTFWLTNSTKARYIRTRIE